jgi:hypothetical protein
MIIHDGNEVDGTTIAIDAHHSSGGIYRFPSTALLQAVDPAATNA